MVTDRYTQELINFGIRLQELRKQANMTQLELETATGIDRSDISKIENGKKNIEFGTIVKFAEALDIKVYQFFQD